MSFAIKTEQMLVPKIIDTPPQEDDTQRKLEYLANGAVIYDVREVGSSGRFQLIPQRVKVGTEVTEEHTISAEFEDTP